MPAMTAAQAVALEAPVVINGLNAIECNAIECNAMLESSEWKAVTA